MEGRRLARSESEASKAAPTQPWNLIALRNPGRGASGAPDSRPELRNSVRTSVCEIAGDGMPLPSPALKYRYILLALVY